MFIGDDLGRRALYSPDRLAIVDMGKSPALRLTFDEMNRRADGLARWLRDHAGVALGDRVAIIANDGVEHLDSFYACGKLGAVHTPLNWRCHWRELQELVERTTPKAILFSSAFTGVVADIRAAMAEPPTHLVHLDGRGLNGSVAFDEIVAQHDGEAVTCESVNEDSTACILFTGGTTGQPKGALISRRQIAWNTLNTVIHDLQQDDVYLNVFPLFHAGGLFCYLASQITMGGTTILVPRFDPDQTLELIDREGVTIFAAVPTMYQMLTESPRWAEASLSSLRFCTSGGAPLPLPLIETYLREKSVRFKQGFGMTEFGPGVFALDAEDADRKAGSIGRPNFFVDARIVDDEGLDVGPDVVGELLLKGPSMCSGYLTGKDDTATVGDRDGWLHTGDLMRRDAEGYFFVVGRTKDMFISGGENVYPAEIERILYRHDAIKDCAVIGVPDAQWGEVGKVYVVLKQGEVATEVELRDFLYERLARFKVPRSVVLVDELPLTDMGKVSKETLRTWAGSQPELDSRK